MHHSLSFSDAALASQNSRAEHIPHPVRRGGLTRGSASTRHGPLRVRRGQGTPRTPGPSRPAPSSALRSPAATRRHRGCHRAKTPTSQDPEMAAFHVLPRSPTPRPGGRARVLGVFSSSRLAHARGPDRAKPRRGAAGAFRSGDHQGLCATATPRPQAVAAELVANRWRGAAAALIGFDLFLQPGGVLFPKSANFRSAQKQARRRSLFGP